MEEMGNKKRVRDESEESEFDSPEVKRLRDDLLGNLDDSDLCTASTDLDSFMKTFEEEISVSPLVVVEPTSGSGESQAELGYLLEASDDELGLPPTTTTPASEAESNDVKELIRVSSDSSIELSSELWRFDDEISGYDSFGFGIAGDDNYNENNHGEYVALDGLFDYSDIGFGSYDAPVPLWRPESTSAQ